jgi:hypothetical protein
MLRTTVARVIANVREVERLPGAEVIRGSDKDISLTEVRSELEDMLQARLDPLVARAGMGLGRESVAWVDHAILSAEIRYDTAKNRAEAYRTALRDYSGVPSSTTPNVGTELSRQRNPGDAQPVTPIIDRTFIDRILEMTAPNTKFRQEITQLAIDASVEAVNRNMTVEQYKQLLKAMQQQSGPQNPDEIAKMLDQISAQAKDLTKRFNEIYAVFSQVALRAGPAMYRIERPPVTSTIRPFGPRDFAFLVLSVLLVAPIVLAIWILLRHHGRKFVHSIR